MTSLAVLTLQVHSLILSELSRLIKYGQRHCPEMLFVIFASFQPAFLVLGFDNGGCLTSQNSSSLRRSRHLFRKEAGVFTQHG